MKVKDVMRTDFISFHRDDRLEHILRTFAKNRITSAPVFDDGDFIGIVGTDEMVKFFTPKRFLFLWKKDAPAPLKKLRTVIAADVVKKPKTVLAPNQKLKDVLDKIAGEQDCLPVLNKNKKLVGIVRNEDMVELFLKKFAKEAYLEPQCTAAAKEKGVGTEIDRVLEIVNRHDWITIREISKKLGISVKTVECMGEVLRDHHLAKMRYSFFRGAELGRIEREKRERK